MSADDYFSIPTSSGSEKKDRNSKEPLSFFAQNAEFRRRAYRNRNSCPPDAPSKQKGAKKSYRTSFPQSKREKKESDTFHRKEDDPPLSSGESPPVIMPPRPRRSSMVRAKVPPDYHPGITSKRVHFNDTVVTYNPRNGQDSAMIDQIFTFLGVQNPARAMQTQTIPQTASYSVAALPIDEVPMRRVYSPLARDLSKTETSLNAELGDEILTPQGERAREQEIKNWLESRSKQQHKIHSEHEYECNDDIHSPYIPNDMLRSDSQTTIRAEKVNKRYSASHYETHSQRRAANARSESHTRPRGNSIPASTKLNNPHRASDGTRTKGDTAWVTANEALKKPNMHRIDSSQPVAEAPDNALHRSDAQRLPSAPRRYKLLRSITRMWAKDDAEAEDTSVPTAS